MEEFEGVEKFDEALSKHYEFDQNIVTSETLDSLADLIDETNAGLEIKFKRPHKYELKDYEEKLYKEVYFE